jgi:hypothetical protein
MFDCHCEARSNREQEELPCIICDCRATLAMTKRKKNKNADTPSKHLHICPDSYRDLHIKKFTVLSLRLWMRRSGIP